MGNAMMCCGTDDTDALSNKPGSLAKAKCNIATGYHTGKGISRCSSRHCREEVCENCGTKSDSDILCKACLISNQNIADRKSVTFDEKLDTMKTNVVTEFKRNASLNVDS
jgi:hypothetical protein